MIVIDASAAVEVLARAPLGPRILDAIEADVIAAPEILVVEVTSALWRQVRAGVLSEAEAQVGLDNLAMLPITLVSHRGLLSGAWALRHRVRITDGYYVALAEQLRAQLLTTDQRLIRSNPGVPILSLT